MADIWQTTTSKVLFFCNLNQISLNLFNGTQDIQAITNGWHLADNIFKVIFVNKNWRILISISLKYVLQGQIDSNPTFIWIMAQCPTSAKPLSESVMA